MCCHHSSWIIIPLTWRSDIMRVFKTNISFPLHEIACGHWSRIYSNLTLPVWPLWNDIKWQAYAPMSSLHDRFLAHIACVFAHYTGKKFRRKSKFSSVHNDIMFQIENFGMLVIWALKSTGAVFYGTWSGNKCYVPLQKKKELESETHANVICELFKWVLSNF